MPKSPSKPIDSPHSHGRAVDALVRQIEGDAEIEALIRIVAEVVAYEKAHAIPPGVSLAERIGSPRHERFARTAMISDIHGNLAGLEAVLLDIESQQCDRILCLGDLVDGGPADEEVIVAIREREILCVRGNHDENHDVELTVSAREFLENLPRQIVEDDMLFVHISPRPINRKINHVVEAWNVFDEHDYRLVFVGHVHVPYIFGKQSTAYGEATRHAFEYNQPFRLARDDRYIVSVGSVGYGRDSVGLLRYAIYDRLEETVELRAIDGPLLPFDYATR